MNKPILKNKFKKHSFEVFNNRPSFNNLRPKQIHSSIITTATEIKSSKGLISADGIIFDNEAIETIAIVTADCLPIYIEGDESSALIHAGWKGIHNMILLESKILKIKPIMAYIGPHIGACCFEVTKEFKEYFPKKEYFLEENKKLYFNLDKVVEDQLKELNSQIQIISSDICTCCHSDYHSYRRNKTVKRNWNIVKKI